MLSSMASNAVLSKARAMYGKRLTEKDYLELLSCKSVSDVAGYLKTKTHYSNLLTEISEASIHRGQLETIIKKKSFIDLSSLCRYEITAGDRFADYILEKTEIEQIMRYITLMGANRADEYLFEIPKYLESHTKVNFNALRKSKSFDDIIEALKDTKYKRIIEQFRPIEDELLNYASIENALYTEMYQNVFKIINSKSRGNERKQLLELFNLLIDYSNFTKIYRLKTFSNFNYDKIKDYIIPLGTISKKHIIDICNAETPDLCVSYMRKTTAGRLLSRLEYNNFNQIDKKLRYITCVKKMRFSVYPKIVMLSYIFLLEIEISNIIVITEGIRYQLPSNQIAELLIIPNISK